MDLIHFYFLFFLIKVFVLFVEYIFKYLLFFNKCFQVDVYNIIKKLSLSNFVELLLMEDIKKNIKMRIFWV